jgi:hypothetical protein
LSQRSQLAALLLLFLVLHALYNWAIPLGEGPDEHGHLAYVLFLAAEGRLPVQQADAATSDVPGEGHQPPLAYALAAPAVAWLPEGERQILLTANPRFVWAGGDEPGAFMRGSRELVPWPPLTLAWHLARGVSGLWGVAAVAFTFLAARRLRPGDPLLPALAAALVGFNPQFLFTAALVSNDALLAALGAALLWWSVVRSTVYDLRFTICVRWAVVAGVIFGLALVTKQSALLLGPVVLAAGWRVAGGRLGRAVAVTLIWGGVALLVSGWWFWRNLALYGDLFGLAVFTTEFATQPFAWGEPAAWAGAARQLFGSFWGRFGWMSLPAPAWALWIYAALCLLAAAGLCRLGVAALARPHDRRAALASPWVPVALAALMALAWTLAFAYTAGLVAWQGRMLFPAASAIAITLAAGLLAALRGLHPSSFILPPLLLLLAAFMPLGAIRPAYPWVALAPREAQAALGQPAFARYAASWERGVVLRGWRLEAAPRAGAELPLTLTWNSLEPVPRPWTVFVHLVDGGGAIVAESNSQPRGGALPFPLWTPGDWMADTHTLALPADLPPGSYELRVGLYRPEKGGQRQKVWAEDGGSLGDQAVLGVVGVAP